MVRKRSWYDVWCGGIELHASSSLASPPSVRFEYGGMCRLKTTGRKRALTASSKHSQPMCLFVCLCVTVQEGQALAASKLLLNNICSVSLERYTAMSGHIMTYNCCSKSIFSSISYWIVPLAGVQEWTSTHWEEGKNVGVDRREGPVAFFQSTTIRNRFSAISLNLQVYWLKTQWQCLSENQMKTITGDYVWLPAWSSFIRCIIVTFTNSVLLSL